MIKKNRVIEKIKAGKPALGGWVMMNSIVSAEILSQAGFDWVCIDAEHSAVSKEMMSNMFRAIEQRGSEPFVRISLNDEVEIKKCMDMGARGIIIPMIKSQADVGRAIEYIKYPPRGMRSFALSRSTGYGEWSDEYFKKVNDETFIGIMIEHIDAIRNLDEIFSSREIHAVLVGQYDLSGSMGIPGKFDHPEFKEILGIIYKKAAEYSVPMGIHDVHPTQESVRNLISKGYTFIGCGIDTLFLLEKAKEFAGLNSADQ